MRIGSPPGRTGGGTFSAPSIRCTRPGERPAAGEHRAADPQRVLEPVEPLADRQQRVPEAVGAVLVLVPRSADPEVRAAAGDDVERRHHLRQQRRVAVGDAGDERAERESACGARGERAEEDVGLGDRVAARHERAAARWKWSMTESASKPARSAACAAATTRSNRPSASALGAGSRRCAGRSIAISLLRPLGGRLSRATGRRR